MAAPKKKLDNVREFPPAMDPESREKQLIALAVNLAEKQLRDGTASPSVINHYLKLGSTRESVEREILANQAKLFGAKADAIQSTQDAGESARMALEAMRNYTSSS